MTNTLIERPPFPGTSTAKPASQWMLRGIDAVSTAGAARQQRADLPGSSSVDKSAAPDETLWPENGQTRLQKLAALRRREARKLAQAVDELGRFSGREDFTAYTCPIIEQLRTLLAELDQANGEGNARELLREIRNTFLDKGWEQYRRQEARRSVAALLSKLAKAEEILAKDVKEAFSQLTRNGLNAVGPSLPVLDEEDEHQDVEEEKEVSG